MDANTVTASRPLRVNRPPSLRREPQSRRRRFRRLPRYRRLLRVRRQQRRHRRPRFPAPKARPPAATQSVSADDIADELIRQLPVGRFKAGDAQKIIKARWPNHTSADTAASFGQYLIRAVWPKLEQRGVVMTRTISPRIYEITEAVKSSAGASAGPAPRKRLEVAKPEPAPEPRPAAAPSSGEPAPEQLTAEPEPAPAPEPRPRCGAFQQRTWSRAAGGRSSRRHLRGRFQGRRGPSGPSVSVGPLMQPRPTPRNGSASGSPSISGPLCKPTACRSPPRSLAATR